MNKTKGFVLMLPDEDRERAKQVRELGCRTSREEVLALLDRVPDVEPAEEDRLR